MYRKFMELLASLAKDIVNRNAQIKEAVLKVNEAEIDIYVLKDVLADFENMGLLDREEIDALKSILVAIFTRNAEIEPDLVYSLIFAQGKKITWH